jgi:hypothetical protein
MEDEKKQQPIDTINGPIDNCSIYNTCIVKYIVRLWQDSRDVTEMLDDTKG